MSLRYSGYFAILFKRKIMKEKPSKIFLQLLEMADIVERHKFKKVDVKVDSQTIIVDDASKKIQQFFNDLRNGKLENDQDAAAFFNLDLPARTTSFHHTTQKTIALA